ncbi:MAG: UbiA family prenyltransferase [Candidatus Thermoplasmatota archaeon]
MMVLLRVMDGVSTWIVSIKNFFIISRAKIQLGTPPHPLLGLILGATTISQLFSSISLVYIMLYFLLITFACNVNCLYDVHIDRKYKQHMSSAVRTLGKENVKKIIILEVVAILGLILFLLDRGYFITAILSLSGLLFGYIYSVEPIRIKGRGFFSPFPVLVGLYTLPVLGGWFIFQNSLSLYLVVFCIGYALLNEGITLVNTCEDYEEDMKEDIRTWAHVLNMKKTMRIAFFFTIFGGLIATAGVVLKPIQIGWTLFSTYSSVFFITLGIINTVIILRIGGDIYEAGSKGDLEASSKNAAKNMPKWFISSRYPLLIMALLPLVQV